jgi:hypothetical protein
MNFDGEKTPTTPGARSIRPIHPEDKPAIEYFVASDAW